MFALLDEIITARKAEAIEYEVYLQRISNYSLERNKTGAASDLRAVRHSSFLYSEKQHPQCFKDGGGENHMGFRRDAIIFHHQRHSREQRIFQLNGSSLSRLSTEMNS